MKVSELKAILDGCVDDAPVDIIDDCGEIHPIADVYERPTSYGTPRYLLDVDPR